MNLTVTCQCGNQFRVAADRIGREVICPRCVAASNPSDDEEIKLQELSIVRPASIFDEADDTGYALDPGDGRNAVNVGPGMYGTVANIRIDENAFCLAYGSNGAWALAGQASDVLVVDMNAHQKFAFFEEHDAAVSSVALSATEPLALSADEGGEIRLWEVPDCKRRIALRAHKDAINSVALSPDGRLALTGGADGRIKLWELDRGARRDLEFADWSKGDEQITYVAFTRDGTHLLAGSSEGRVSMWHVESGRRIQWYDGLELPVSCVRLSDEKGIISASTEPVAYQGASYVAISHWHARTGRTEGEVHVAVQSPRCCITPDRNGQRILLGGGAHPWLKVLSLQDGRCLYEYSRLLGVPLCLAVAPHNNRLIAAMATRCLQVFGMETS